MRLSSNSLQLAQLTKWRTSVDEVALAAHTSPMAATVTLKSTAQGDLVRAVVDATADLPPKELELEGGHVLTVLLERLADRVLPTSDPLAMARFRGVIAMRELLGAEGGALSAADVAQLLGISRQAVDKRRKLGQLLALEVPKRGLLYPGWQFTDAGAPLPGFLDVLNALGAHDPWAQARFFLSGNDRLGGKRPLDVLRAAGVDRVLAAAGMFGEHGAA